MKQPTHRITDIQDRIMAVWNNSDLQTEVFYPGIRADVAYAIGVAPNSATFNAAFDSLYWYQSGDGKLYCQLDS